jgi:hypothetical protein
MYRIALLLSATLFFLSCRKEKAMRADLTVSIEYRINNQPLLHDTLMYQHPAGYLFSVSRIQFYVSELTFKKSNGETQYHDAVQYLDAGIPGKNSFKLSGMPIGSYKGVSFLIGLDTTKNKTGYLATTVDNLNMAWPDMMGGGYHFIKMEGLYKDSAGIHGYSVHLGQNGFTVPILLDNKAFEIQDVPNTMVLKMNIEEWFKNPTLYDFNNDGNYSMGDSVAMKKLVNNAGDIFNE